MYIMSKFTFYCLSWTWGILMTILGHVIAGILLLCGYRPYKNGYGWAFEIGENWGGIDLGYICVVQKNPGQYLLAHEFGHSVQNCFFGPFFIPCIALPSAIRYHYRNWRECHGKINHTDYYDIWFEKQASSLGIKYLDK